MKLLKQPSLSARADSNLMSDLGYPIVKHDILKSQLSAEVLDVNVRQYRAAP